MDHAMAIVAPAVGQLPGTISVLDVACRYDEEGVKILQSVTPLLVASFLRELKIPGVGFGSTGCDLGLHAVV